jgi:hypothetical protein
MAAKLVDFIVQDGKVYIGAEDLVQGFGEMKEHNAHSEEAVFIFEQVITNFKLFAMQAFAMRPDQIPWEELDKISG